MQNVTKLVLLLLVVMPGLAVAGNDAKTFEELDQDGDGMISKSEVLPNTVLQKQWSTADADANDKLDISEFSAFEASGRFTPPEDMEEPGLGAAPFESKSE